MGKTLLLILGGYIVYEYVVRGNDVFAGLFGSSPAPVVTGTGTGTTGTGTSTGAGAPAPAPGSTPPVTITGTPRITISAQLAQVAAYLNNAAYAAGQSSPLTFDQWNYYYQHLYGAALHPQQGVETQVTPMTAQQFIASATAIVATVAPPYGAGVRTSSQLPTPPVSTQTPGGRGMHGLRGFPVPPLSSWKM